MRFLRTLMLAFSVTLLAACGNVGQPAQEAPIAVSEEAAASLETKMGQAAQSQEPTVEVQVTQEEVTSYLRLRIQDQRLQNAQVNFRDGTVILTGQATLSNVSQNFRIVAAPTVDAEGVLQFDFREARLGPVPLPNEVLQVANENLRQAIVGNQLGRLQRVEVGQGTLTIVGERAQ